jgi:hypothetical protein
MKTEKENDSDLLKELQDLSLRFFNLDIKKKPWYDFRSKKTETLLLSTTFSDFDLLYIVNFCQSEMEKRQVLHKIQDLKRLLKIT